MNLVFARQPYINSSVKSVFLAGPTPRDEDTSSWRPEAVGIFKRCGFDGTIYIPERDWSEEDDKGFMYGNQIEWEHNTLDASMAILMWVPRELTHMPAFTTNIEFGMYVKSGKLYYGRPNNTPKTRYMDYCYEKFCRRTPEVRLNALITRIVLDIDEKT